MRNSLESPVRASRLAAELGLTWEGEDVEIRTVAPLSSAAPHALTFAKNMNWELTPASDERNENA